MTPENPENLFLSPPIEPGEQIQILLDQKGWTQDDLASVTKRSRQAINEIISGKRGITAEMAVALGHAFGNSPAFWINLDAAYRLAQVSQHDGDAIQRHARLFDLAPIKEMQRRGWIGKTKNFDDIEAELKKFFGVESLGEEPKIGAATRKSDGGEPLSPSQRAWCFRVRQLARSQMVAEYSNESFDRCRQQLRRLAANPEEINKVPQILAANGIRFAIIEPLQSTKVDGVAMWLDQDSPVIGMSLRHDRVDYFWFTLCHELAHIKFRDESPLDSIITDGYDTVVMKSEMERRADDEAADMLIPKSEMESFIARVGPLYSKDRINRFANRLRIYPGIIVGQLQHRREIGFSANRELLIKIRNDLLLTAVVDGWGHSIDTRSL